MRVEDWTSFWTALILNVETLIPICSHSVYGKKKLFVRIKSEVFSSAKR